MNKELWSSGIQICRWI